MDERLIRELILQMKLGRLDTQYFQDKFGVTVLDHFKKPIKTLLDSGFLTIENGFLHLNRDGLLRVDGLIHEFFLEQHKDSRYA